MKFRKIVVNDLMQRGYSYQLTEPVGRSFDRGFHPELSPSQLLALGIFGGKCMTDCGARASVRRCRIGRTTAEKSRTRRFHSKSILESNDINRASG